MGWNLSDLANFPLLASGVETEPRLKSNDSSKPPRVISIISDPDPDEEEAIKLCWEILTRSQSRSSSQPPPVSSDPIIQTLETFLKKGHYTLKIKKGIRKKDLFRFLLAKMLYESEEGLHLDEFLVLWELYLQLLDLLSKDPSFRNRYEDFFRNSFHFFREFGNQKVFPVRVEEVENLQYLERIQKVLYPMLPTRSAYFGLKGQKSLKSGFSLVFEGEILYRKAPEARRIGVGYRDKGSRRDTAIDGSPDWREVAGSLQERRIRIVEDFLGLVRESPNFDWDLVYNPESLQGEADEENNTPQPIEFDPDLL